MYLYKLKTLIYNKNPELGGIPVVLRRFLELDFIMYFSIFLIIIGICRLAQISMFHLIFPRKYFWWCQRSRTGLTDSKEFTKTYRFKNIQISASLKKLFVWVVLYFFVPLKYFSLIWRRHHHCRWRAPNFDPCLALMAIDQWRFFSMPHLQWHSASVLDDRLRGPVTLAPNAEHLAMELSLPILMT